MRKLVKKVLKKIVKKLPIPQDSSYWVKRPLSDKKVDWNYGEKSWIEGYCLSIEHPHRQDILKALETFKPFGAVLEVGCNIGANLLNIAPEYPENQLAGIDVNPHVIERAEQLLPKGVFKIASVLDIPFDDNEFDVVLSDAMLLYITPKEIDKALDEMTRVTKKGIILVERFAKKDKIVGRVWGRNYKELLEARGFEVIETDISWPSSKNWERHGRLYISHRQ